MPELNIPDVNIPQLEELKSEIRDLRRMLENMQIKPKPEWLTIDEACKELGVSRSTINRRIEAGTIEAKDTGKLRRVRVG